MTDKEDVHRIVLYEEEFKTVHFDPITQIHGFDSEQRISDLFF
jgi:hypothetical protein